MMLCWKYLHVFYDFIRQDVFGFAVWFLNMDFFTTVRPFSSLILFDALSMVHLFFFRGILSSVIPDFAIGRKVPTGISVMPCAVWVCILYTMYENILKRSLQRKEIHLIITRILFMWMNALNDQNRFTCYLHLGLWVIHNGSPFIYLFIWILPFGYLWNFVCV